MRLLAWDELPDAMKNEAVRPYYDSLRLPACNEAMLRHCCVGYSAGTAQPNVSGASRRHKAGFSRPCFLSSGACDAVWEAVPHFQISNHVRPCRPNGQRGDDRRGSSHYPRGCEDTRLSLR